MFRNPCESAGVFHVILAPDVKYTVTTDSTGDSAYGLSGIRERKLEICGGDRMVNNRSGSKTLKTGKAFALSLIFLVILFGVIGLFIRFTPLPERFLSLYVLGGLCVACFFVGLLSGTAIGNKGILFGALFAAVFLLLILMVAVLITGRISEEGILRLRYIPCLAFGSFGGMFGVNLTND